MRAERPVTYRPDCSFKMNDAVELWCAISDERCNECVCLAALSAEQSPVIVTSWQVLLPGDLRVSPNHSPTGWSRQLQAVRLVDGSTAGLIHSPLADTLGRSIDSSRKLTFGLFFFVSKEPNIGVDKT